MSISIRTFCERLAEIQEGKLTITWTSVLANHSDALSVLKVTGELIKDRIVFPEEVEFYGYSREFYRMSHNEKVTSSRIAFSPVRGIELFVETLL